MVAIGEGVGEKQVERLQRHSEKTSKLWGWKCSVGSIVSNTVMTQYGDVMTIVTVGIIL